MSNKDINIHVRAKQAEQTKSKLDSVARSAKAVGDKTVSGQRQVADSTDKASKKLDKQKSTFDSLKSKVLGYITAAVGIERLIAMFGRLLEKLQAIQKIQSELYEKSLEPMGLGQILVGQTGQGSQQMWAKHILDLQKAGGLESPQAAQRMMVAGDIAFGAHGGVAKPAIRGLLKELAPMFGDAGMGGEEIAKFFEFASTAGVNADGFFTGF